MNAITEPVVVGVTGAGRNTEALRFAIAEARALRCGLTLVHAVHPVLPPPPQTVSIAEETWAEVGAHIVAAARSELVALLAGEAMRVTTMVHLGSPSTLLCELSRRAERIVLQHPDGSRRHRIVTGSTITTVAAKAHCPVVAVPASSADLPPTACITAGVDHDAGPPAVVEAAFAEASARRSSLRLMHAWQVSDLYDDVLPDTARWTMHSRAVITAAAADTRFRYPDVVADVVVRREWPAQALVAAAAASDLLVVGRHRGPPAVATPVGSLTRTVLLNAPCPVMVVPVDVAGPLAPHGTDGDDLFP